MPNMYRKWWEIGVSYLKRSVCYCLHFKINHILRISQSVWHFTTNVTLYILVEMSFVSGGLQILYMCLNLYRIFTLKCKMDIINQKTNTCTKSISILFLISIKVLVETGAINNFWCGVTLYLENANNFLSIKMYTSR